MMKTFEKILVRFCAVAMIACLAFNVYAGAEIPMKSKASGKITTSTFIANPFGPAGNPILNLPFLHVTAEATGHATHLGKYSIQLEHLVHFEFIDGQLMAVSLGTYIVTAANGDTQYGTYRNEQVFGENDFVGDALLLGGTGRFQGVTGYETTIGSLTRSPDGLHAFWFEHDGWITSVGYSK